MKYIMLGKIVNTHGLKGEIRIISDFIYKNKYFKEHMTLYIGKDKTPEEVGSYRKHKTYDMITFKGLSNINDVLKYKGQYIFGSKDDLILEGNEYLDEDLLNLDVFMENELIGKVKKVVRYSKNNLLLVTNGEKDFYIPYNFDIIKEIDLPAKRLAIIDIKGMV